MSSPTAIRAVAPEEMPDEMVVRTASCIGRERPAPVSSIDPITARTGTGRYAGVTVPTPGSRYA
ncbi:hypothetical protein ACL02S_13920 [Nocardia sp. 004]|uniref:hypothetical protein n=1 Tax=Nocardia sp. 004 TaxID=3385978 RepID=UPI0039A14E41